MTPPRVTRRAYLGAGLAGGALAAMQLAACTLQADEDHDGPHAPDSQPLAQPPRVAWVLSSGGPRGFVHIGVIKALDELGLRPDLLAGSSVGALLGVLYAAGLSGRQLEALALDLQPLSIAQLAIGSNERFNGAPLARWVREHLGQRRLEQLTLPVVCVAKRLGDGSAVGLTRGDAGVAVQAATAIEGRFTPVRIRGQRLADADLVMPLPVRLARRLGAQTVLAVDASAHEDRAPAEARRYRTGDLHKRELTQPDAQAADLLLHPDFGYWVSLSREFRERSIAVGYQATMASAERLRELHRPAAARR